MSPINVLVAATTPDLKAQLIAKSVAARSDMTLVLNDSVTVRRVDEILDAITDEVGCALVIVGNSMETYELGQRWLAKRGDLVVLYVDVIGDNVRIGLSDPELDPLLTSLYRLVRRFGRATIERFDFIRLATQRSLLQATINWVHAVLGEAIGRFADRQGDLPGLAVARDTLLDSLKHISGKPASESALERALAAADAELEQELAEKNINQNTEPLAVAVRTFHLNPLEYRLMALALAPELDFRFQRCIGFLLDDLGRRVGTMGLYTSLLGPTVEVREALAHAGKLSDWRVLEGQPGSTTPADVPLQVDHFLAQWLLGSPSALATDPLVRRVLHLDAWSGRQLLGRIHEYVEDDAQALLNQLGGTDDVQWYLLDGSQTAVWRALLELGAHHRGMSLIRVEPTRMASEDALEIEECAKRVGRMARLTCEPLVIDLTGAQESEGLDRHLQLFFRTLGNIKCKAAVISTQPARIVRQLDAMPYEVIEAQALSTPTRIATMRAAAKVADVYLTEDAAEALVNRVPLQVDGLEQAMHLAAKRPKNFALDDPARARFLQACRDVASEELSHFAERIDPIFTLDQVVLPADRKSQLLEIVNHVRLATRVLDGWKFRDRLPYGRGVTALFYGPSGTGKTMAAMGVANDLSIQILRLDLSRVVSKYIGDTEKNIDRVFQDAQRSGSALLIDEADALLGKRSEVKDAHDRYANIEVAYLLQRLEAYEGLAVLTTNMKHNMDAAFIRRLRFIIDFPRPDAAAREKIWRQSLPPDSHVLDDADYRLLARQLDLTGANINNITLRAAFIAATEHMRINLQHIARAIRAEFAKLGIPSVELDLSKKRSAA